MSIGSDGRGQQGGDLAGAVSVRRCDDATMQRDKGVQEIELEKEAVLFSAICECECEFVGPWNSTSGCVCSAIQSPLPPSLVVIDLMLGHG